MTKLEKEENKIINIIKNAQGNSLDVYSVLYEKCMNDKREAPQILKELLEYSEQVGVDDGTSQVVTKEREERFSKMYGKLLWDETEKLIKKNLSKEKFYQELWTMVFESEDAPDSREKGAVCMKILNEKLPFLPYYEAIDIVRMDDGEYEERIKKITPFIQESIHMLNRHFEQKTEEASQFCRIVRNLEKEDAAVYMASFLSILKKAYVADGYRRGEQESREKPL